MEIQITFAIRLTAPYFILLDDVVLDHSVTANSVESYFERTSSTVTESALERNVYFLVMRLFTRSRGIERFAILLSFGCRFLFSITPNPP